MKKFFFSLAALALASSAFAQQVASSGVANHGQIHNIVTTFATTTGTGTAYSAATNTQSAASSGFAVTGFSSLNGTNLGTAVIGGNSSTSGSGTAFNVSTGHGTGSASSQGWSDSDVLSTASYYGPGQWINLYGNSDSGSQNLVLNGTDVSVFAGRNQGGFATAATEGSFRAIGGVGSTISGNNQLTIKSTYGSVSDIKNSISQVNAGAILVNGVQLNNAQTAAQAGTVVHVLGAFGDPI